MPALGRGPGAEGLGHLRQRHRGAHHVGRLGGDDRGRGVHHHHELLGLGRYVAGGERVRRQHEARDDVDLVADHQLLRESLGDIRRHAAGILDDQFDLLAADGLAVLLHVGLDAVLHLDAGVGELARQRHDQADLDGVLGAGRRGAGEQHGGDAADRGGDQSHWYPPEMYVMALHGASTGSMPMSTWRVVALQHVSRVRGAYFIRAFTGSLTFSTLSISTLRKPSGVFSTFWM